MKSALLLLIAPLILFAQFPAQTFTLPNTSALESPISVTESAASIPNVISFIQSAPPNGGWPNLSGFLPSNTTLGAAITDTSGTIVTLTSAADLAFGNGLNIDSETFAVTGFPNVTGPTYSSGASGCTNGTQEVQFTNGAFGSITVSGGVPSGAVTILSEGNLSLASAPTSGTIAACTSPNATFTGGSALQSNVVTVIRREAGTTAATHSNGAAVTVLRFGGGTYLLKGFIADGLGSVVQAKLSGTVLATQSAAAAAANAQIAQYVAGSVR